MKLKIIYISIILILGFITYINLFTSNKHYPKPSYNAAIKSTHYNWLRLHDPVTNEIPKNITAKEQAFKQSMIQQLPKNASPVAKEWVSRGPYNIGGRTKAIAIDIKDENTILAGGVSCGMWKSIDVGDSWIKTTKPDQIHSVSCVAQNKAEGKEHVWYYGTGEWAPAGRGGSASVPLGTNSYYRGDGIFKSTDSGDSWNILPSTTSGTPTITDSFDFIWKLSTFGEDGIYAATSSGLFKSTNGGESWNHVLDFGEKYPSCEIALTSQEICYATIGGDGPDNGIYRSIDAEFWENLSPPDWPDSTVRTVIAIAPSNENVVYFLTEVAHLKQQLRKYEQGVGWTNLNQNLPFGGEMITYGGNMLILYVKPDDENTLFLGTVGLYRSTNAGQSFEVIGAYSDFHVDQHAIAFLPSDPKTMIVGNDGGLFKTHDNMAEVAYDPKSGEYHIEWESLNNGYLTTQFYSIAIDHGIVGSETVLGGTQDNAWLYTHSP